MHAQYYIMLATDIGHMLDKAGELGKNWGGSLIAFCGVILMIAAFVILVKGLLSQGRGQPVPWFQFIIMLLIGGFMMVKGFQGAEIFADIGADTLQQLAQ